MTTRIHGPCQGEGPAPAVRGPTYTEHGTVRSAPRSVRQLAPLRGTALHRAIFARCKHLRTPALPLDRWSDVVKESDSGQGAAWRLASARLTSRPRRTTPGAVALAFGNKKTSCDETRSANEWKVPAVAEPTNVLCVCRVCGCECRPGGLKLGNWNAGKTAGAGDEAGDVPAPRSRIELLRVLGKSSRFRASTSRRGRDTVTYPLQDVAPRLPAKNAGFSSCQFFASSIGAGVVASGTARSQGVLGCLENAGKSP
ncbi:hypothetical protein QBC34DRAFT_211188 [Podospora aff. communis PSN243]|uniref:Uncharacterized protein n=1 Tax=Podospora aff. communis PSN243 TaxID=3040156 RepID=A0AAV9G3S2_9PEZI|nr:hypothetical protein QBC34DRAFT_211188 [Podospora aff. communis PSN243]